jgi:CheY-like chemotaxis protein
MPLPAVIYVCGPQPQVFGDIESWLRQRTALFVVANAEEAGKLCASTVPAPVLIVVAQSTPGEIAVNAWVRLRSAAPLTPIVCLLDSWCEGELRSGKPWPGAIRVYAHQFVARVGAQLERYVRDGAMSWSPPFTATEEGRLRNPQDQIRAADARAVLVVSKDRASASAICDSLESAGFRTDWNQNCDRIEIDGAAAVVWDCPAGFAESRQSFVELVQRLRSVPVIAVIGFPRPEDRIGAMTLGAAAVISKPFLVEDLLWQVRECFMRQN